MRWQVTMPLLPLIWDDDVVLLDDDAAADPGWACWWF